MRQNYEQIALEQTSQCNSLIDIIDQIIRIKHHEQMIDNRHQRIFLKYFTISSQLSNSHHQWAKDILLFAQEKQYINKFYQMQTIIQMIRQCILNRINIDDIAPILSTTIGEENIINEIKKWNKILIQLPQTKTMNTQSSKIYQKYKNIINDTLLLSNQNKYHLQYLSHDCSNDTLNKITQDLSKMLKNICIQQENRKKINVKFKKSLIPSSNNLNKKYLKKKISTHKLYSIRSNQLQNNNYLNYQYYPQQEHHKIQSKIIEKNSEIQIKKKCKSIHSTQNKLQLNKKCIKTSNNLSQQKIPFIPLTPKSRNTYKIKQSQKQIKTQRYSLKPNQKDNNNKLNKSPPIHTQRKQLKSAIEHKAHQSKKQKVGKGK